MYKEQIGIKRKKKRVGWGIVVYVEYRLSFTIEDSEV